ncbi:MAG: hypothetical protein JSU94_10160 [Phycisphaerales bacterium]|nr:MAG: hypothetical protein JSU94_10160 [Phycisphaerales bacterium]
MSKTGWNLRQVFARLFGIALLLVSAGGAFADVRLPAVIGDNMVLQGGGKAPIWGWAEPKELVTVRIGAGAKARTVRAGEDGRWMLKIDVPDAGGPYEMTIRGKNTITVRNILVGEVWVCSGQSNMQWPVQRAANSAQEIAAADYPKIRLFTVQRKVADSPQSDCTGQWAECSSATAGGFSAVAYFFGRELHKELDVPVGLIHTSWGGTPAESWTRREVLEGEEDFAPILERHDEMIARYPEAKRQYERRLEQWKQAAKKARAEGKKAPGRPRTPSGPGSSRTPGGLYNAMIAPLIPYSIKGAIWYQGEANAGRAYQYRKLFGAMIRNWRQDWGQGDFAFLFVQLANYMAVAPEPGESAWAELREAQSMALGLANTGMAVIIDIGEANNIHPKNKQDVGRRLALWALAGSYGKDVVYSGPIYKSMEVRSGEVVLHFDHAGGGLVGRGGALKGFAVAGEDRKFVWADARIEGETVVVRSEKVGRPVAVRYAWANNPVCNLYNREGLPASPFRTDDWPGITVEKK